MTQELSSDQLNRRIFTLRGEATMLAPDLAELYGVEVRSLNQAVRRNADHFPEDFAFQLSPEEWKALRSQIVILDGPGRYPKYRPWAFTEHGVTMLASLLKSPRAVEVSLFVVREFVRLRREATTYVELAKRIDGLESRMDDELKRTWSVIAGMLALPPSEDRRIGFRNEGPHG